jgi:hypothetical protein
VSSIQLERVIFSAFGNAYLSFKPISSKLLPAKPPPSFLDQSHTSQLKLRISPSNKSPHRNRGRSNAEQRGNMEKKAGLTSIYSRLFGNDAGDWHELTAQQAERVCQHKSHDELSAEAGHASNRWVAYKRDRIYAAGVDAWAEGKGAETTGQKSQAQQRLASAEVQARVANRIGMSHLLGASPQHVEQFGPARSVHSKADVLEAFVAVVDKQGTTQRRASRRIGSSSWLTRW